MSDAVHQLKVMLPDIEPPIWRRIRVPADIHLDHLHTALGWHDSHLHEFVVGGRRYTLPEPDEPEMRRWVGRRFDPEKFDLVAVNRRLRLLE